MKATSSRLLSTTWMNCVRAFSISVALLSCSLAPSSARADQAADVASILNILQSALLGGSAADAFITYPIDAIDDNLDNAVGILDSTLRDIAYIPNSVGGISFWNMYLNRILTGNTLGVPVSQQDGNVLGLLRSIRDRSYTNDLDVINGALTGIMDLQGYYLPTIRDNTYNAATDLNYLLAGWVGGGQYTNAWDVALVPDQLDEFRQMLQALEHTSGTSGETIVGAIEDATRTNAAIAGDLHALRLGLLDEYDTLDTVEEHADTVSEYVDEEVETNALAALTITPGDAGDLSPVLDLVDPDSFDVLPSLSGGDPVVQVFTASRDSNLPAFSIDFSLPSGFRTFVHAVCVWIWRMLFFLAMWRLVNEEFGYWSTLGGSAG